MLPNIQGQGRDSFFEKYFKSHDYVDIYLTEQETGLLLSSRTYVWVLSSSDTYKDWPAIVFQDLCVSSLPTHSTHLYEASV